jgi:hypothetical protein
MMFWGCAEGEPGTILVYFSSETAQAWKSGGREPDQEGGAFWLPGGVVLELRMVPATSRGVQGDAQVGFF